MQTSEVYGSEDSTGVLIEPLGQCFTLYLEPFKYLPRLNLFLLPLFTRFNPLQFNLNYLIIT